MKYFTITKCWRGVSRRQHLSDNEQSSSQAESKHTQRRDTAHHGGLHIAALWIHKDSGKFSSAPAVWSWVRLYPPLLLEPWGSGGLRRRPCGALPLSVDVFCLLDHHVGHLQGNGTSECWLPIWSSLRGAQSHQRQEEYLQEVCFLNGGMFFTSLTAWYTKIQPFPTNYERPFRVRVVFLIATSFLMLFSFLFLWQ